MCCGRSHYPAQAGWLASDNSDHLKPGMPPTWDYCHLHIVLPNGSSQVLVCLALDDADLTDDNWEDQSLKTVRIAYTDTRQWSRATQFEYRPPSVTTVERYLFVHLPQAKYLAGLTAGAALYSVFEGLIHTEAPLATNMHLTEWMEYNRFIGPVVTDRQGIQAEVGAVMGGLPEGEVLDPAPLTTSSPTGRLYNVNEPNVQEYR